MCLRLSKKVSFVCWFPENQQGLYGPTDEKGRKVKVG